MELVPIVIAALEIVSVLAVITLIVSYIGYRIRLKSAVNEDEPPYDLKPHFPDRGLKRVTYLTREIINIPKNIPIHSKPKQPKAVKEPPRPPAAVNPVEEPKSKRLQVVKSLPVQSAPEKDTVEKEPSKEKKNLSSLGDDILNKYTDEDSGKLFSLKTGKTKQKD